MKTLTFREPEVLQIFENNQLDEWRSLVERLGMKGQMECNKGSDANPIPYMRLNSKWHKVLRTVCPSASDYKAYNHSTVPMDVLEEISFALSIEVFDNIQIWYDEVEKDPFVVGMKRNANYSQKFFLIAQFGEELLPFEVLETKAKERLHKHVSDNIMQFTNIQKTVENYLERDNISPLIDVATAHGRLFI